MHHVATCSLLVMDDEISWKKEALTMYPTARTPSSFSLDRYPTDTAMCLT